MTDKTPATEAGRLSPDEEAEIRQWVRFHPPSNAHWFERLLATIDFERQAAAQARAEALRDAAERVLETYPPHEEWIRRTAVLAILTETER